MNNELSPKLIVTDPDAAISFYSKALDAALALRVADDNDVVVHAELTMGGSMFALAQAVDEWGWHAPESLSGSPVLLTITASDPDSTAERMAQNGASIVIPVENRPYGKRQGRVRDPHGHLWIISGDHR
ncbi:putative glyoxalase superfamily protein PhnB [Lipingzhangella halophila]|uniref:Putative glyoxalase superfamily protein PhnB n=1 Tax=Lipingzhangella halophila TaxID=1783352 RepID=A0A7W7RMZ1_9ACTN|nr:VOC family protein [Lipingzhangella halophila]MBB4934985.1 putative glyoxalase superfamily protein PhnB [Lipingzhangella halophila]